MTTEEGCLCLTCCEGKAYSDTRRCAISQKACRREKRDRCNRRNFIKVYLQGLLSLSLLFSPVFEECEKHGAVIREVVSNRTRTMACAHLFILSKTDMFIKTTGGLKTGDR